METMAVMTAAISQIPMSDDVEDPPNVSSKQMNSQHDEPIRKDLQSGGGVHKTARHAWNERKNKREIPGKLTQAKCVRPPLHVHFRRCTTCTYQCQAEQSASHVEWCVPCNRGTRQPHFQFQYCLPYYLTFRMFQLNRNLLLERRESLIRINVDVCEKGMKSDGDEMGGEGSWVR